MNELRLIKLFKFQSIDKNTKYENIGRSFIIIMTIIDWKTCYCSVIKSWKCEQAFSSTDTKLLSKWSSHIRVGNINYTRWRNVTNFTIVRKREEIRCFRFRLKQWARYPVDRVTEPNSTANWWYFLDQIRFAIMNKTK